MRGGAARGVGGRSGVLAVGRLIVVLPVVREQQAVVLDRVVPMLAASATRERVEPREDGGWQEALTEGQRAAVAPHWRRWGRRGRSSARPAAAASLRSALGALRLKVVRARDALRLGMRRWRRAAASRVLAPRKCGCF